MSMMTGIFNAALRAAGLKDASAQPLDSDFAMTRKERAASRRDMEVLSMESDRARNAAVELAARTPTSCP